MKILIVEDETTAYENLDSIYYLVCIILFFNKF